MYCYEFGEIGFGFEIEKQLVESQQYGLFRIDEKRFFALRDRHIYRITNSNIEVCGKHVFRSPSYSVYSHKNQYIRVSNRFEDENYNYIFTEKYGESGGTISVTGQGIVHLKTTAELFRIIDFVSALIHYNAVIIHASMISTDYGIVLFSAESGAGKSTQAELWNRFRNSEIINGDRAIIRNEDGKLKAYGLPFCGSSGICRNDSGILRAIVCPEKSPDNNVVQLNNTQKIINISSQLTCGIRKQEDTKRILNLTENLINNTDIIQLCCTPDLKAVETLEKYLAGE